MLLLLLPNSNNAFPEKKPELKYSLSELFDFFVGISEDKFDSYLEIEQDSRIPIQYIRLSSINELDNTILKASKDLKESDKNIENARQKYFDGKIPKKVGSIKGPIKDERILLQPNDYLITSRGNTRIIIVDKYFSFFKDSKNIVATQQFIIVRPKKQVLTNWGKKFLDFVMMVVGRYFNERSEYSNIREMELKEKSGYTLQYDKFEVGAPIILLDKNGNKKEWEDRKYFAVSKTNPYQAKLEFTVFNNTIEKIERSSLHIITIKELENVTIIVNEDENERAMQADLFLKLKFEKDEAILKYNEISSIIAKEMISK